jgi:N-acetylglutamate synthase-like GNAT family acetyltransferase
MLSIKIENIQKNKRFIPKISNWIYSEFIIGHIPDIEIQDIEKAIKNRKMNEIPMTLICLKDNNCIGTISIFSNDLSKLPQLTPWIAALYIDKNYRNKGFGKQLMKEAENIVKKLGYEKLYLRTETASKYYNKLGWNKIKELTDENNIDTSVFEKIL